MQLTGKNMTGGYTQVDILNDCSLTVQSGELVVIVGPNGAGKSTAMKALLGMVNLRQGQVTLDGVDLDNLSPQERVMKGMAFVPQTHNVFSHMSVEENLEMGVFNQPELFDEAVEKIYQVFPILSQKRNQFVGELSGGQRQQVAIGRAMMCEPSVLMLDEPTAGISPIVMDELFNLILKIKKSGVAVLMVEQNARQALNIADRGYVLKLGGNFRDGTGQELLNDQEVRQSFLGG